MMIRILLLFLLIRTSYPSTTSTFKLVRIFHKSTSLYNNTFKTTHIQNPHTFTIKHLPIPPRFQNQRNKLNNQFPLNTVFQRHPDITDKQTILNMAQMTANAYSTPSIEKWVDVPGWNVSTRFGWESDGLRGYVYSDELAEVFVIVIKGTSAGIFEGTGVRDLYNDNVMFSCCCAYPLRHPVCPCATSSTQCSSTCLVETSNFSDSYYNLAQTIYVAIEAMYPQTSIWVTGHSLGGSIASLVALTNGIPAIAFESVGDLKYAKEIGLIPDGDIDEFLRNLPIYHFGNDMDPIYLGICNGYTSSCYLWGFILETKCHVGKKCMINTNATSTNIRYHQIDYFLSLLESTDDVPECVVDKGCLAGECVGWKYD